MSVCSHDVWPLCPVPKCLHYPPKQTHACSWAPVYKNLTLPSVVFWLGTVGTDGLTPQCPVNPASLCLLPISDLHLQGSACHNPVESHGAASCSPCCHALVHHRQMLTPLRCCARGSCQRSHAFILSSEADAEERGPWSYGNRM